MMSRQLLIFLTIPFMIAVVLSGLLWSQTSTTLAQAEGRIVQVTATVPPTATPQAEGQNEPDNNAEAYQFVLARQLGAQAQLELAQNPDPVLGTLLAAESLRRFQTIDGDIPLRRGLELLSWQTVFTAPYTASCGGVIGLSTDNRLLTTYSVSCRYNDQDISIKVWDITTGQQISELAYDPDPTPGSLEPPFYGADFSSNGRWLVTSSVHSARVWDVATGQMIREIPTDYGADFSPDSRWLIVHPVTNTLSILDAATLAPVSQINQDGDIFLWQFSPRNQLILATSTASDTIRFWNPATGQPGSQINLKGHKVSLAKFSPDGQLLATAGNDRTGVQLWDVATSQALTQTAQGIQVTNLTISPDKQWLVTLGHQVQVWDMSTGLEVARLVHQSSYPANSLDFSPNGRWLATGGDDALRVWEVGTWREVARMGTNVGQVRFSADSQKLIARSGGYAGQVWQWVSDQNVVKTLSPDPAYKVAYSPDGHWIAASGNTGIVHLWDANTLVEVAALEHKDRTNFAFSPNSQWLATSSQDGMVRVWEIATRQEVFRQTYQTDASVITFSPNNQWLLVKVGQQLQVWEITTDQELAHLDMADKLYMATTSKFSPDGRRVVTTWDNILIIWDTASGREVTRQRLDDWTPPPAFSPDGHLLARNGGLYKIAILDVASDQSLMSLDHEGPIRALAFSPDGHWLATGTSFIDADWNNRGKTRLWEVATGKLVYELNSGAVDSLFFSRDGRWLITQGRIWDVITGREIARLPQYSLVEAFSPDSRWLATVAWPEGGPTQVWAWQAPDLIAAACARLPRNLTPTEWRYYVGDESYQPTCPDLPTLQ